MKPNRRSPVFRAAAWFFGLALIMPAALQGTAKAQVQQQLRVIVADIVNKSTNNQGSNVGVEATAAVYNELSTTGAGRYYVFQTSEVQKEAQTLGIRTASVPGQPNFFSQPDLLRIAKSLNADAVVQGYVSTSAPARGRPISVALDVRVHDMTTDEDINGGAASITESPRPGQAADPEELLTKAVEDVTQEVVRQITQRQLFIATVLNVNGNIAILNIGKRNSLQVGDDITVYRASPNGAIRVGQLKAARVYPQDSEADITKNIGGIQVEDQARIIYRPGVVVNLGGGVTRAPSHNTLSLSAIGATLAVIGLGIVVATAARGGQASVSGVTAEAGTQSTTPIVRVRFSDNLFGGAGVQQYKIFRLPDFPFGTVGTGGNNNGGGGGNTTAAGVPVGTATPTIREYVDLPSPNFHYKNGTGFLVGNSNGGLNSGSQGGGGGGSNNQNQGCNVTTPANAATLDVGFLPGTSYRYQVTAVILRQANLSGGGQNGGGGGGLGGGGGGGIGGGGGGGGNNQGGGVECIETDPVQSGLATPLNPVILTSPANQSNGTFDIRTFNPQFASRAGADVYQLEVSTDRSFRNPKLIYKVQIISTSPNSDGVPQGVPNAINLQTIPELLADPVFAAYANAAQGSNPTQPTLYWRVGARHDEDVPGPINWISQNPSDPDKTFRFVYSQVFSFIPPVTPPPPPGRSLAGKLNTLYNGKAFSRLPLPGDTAAGRGVSQRRVLSPQEILTGAGRGRH